MAQSSNHRGTVFALGHGLNVFGTFFEVAFLEINVKKNAKRGRLNGSLVECPCNGFASTRKVGKLDVAFSDSSVDRM